MDNEDFTDVFASQQRKHSNIFYPGFGENPITDHPHIGSQTRSTRSPIRTMSTTPQTIALAGVGDLGKYICTALLASPHFNPIVLSRSSSSSTSQTPPKTTWFSTRNIPIHKTDYTIPSLLQILNTTKTTTLISLINDPTPNYVTTHTSLLRACQHSTHCKRLIPSEYIGDTELHPLKPTFYAHSRAPFRDILRQQTEIEWTLFNVGWLMDYFLPAAKTHMKPATGVFPIDLEGWKALVRGSGAEMQSWCCGRDVGRSVVALCGAEKWVCPSHQSLHFHHAFLVL